MKESKNEHKKKTLSHKEKKERSQMDCVKYKRKKKQQCMDHFSTTMKEMNEQQAQHDEKLQCSRLGFNKELERKRQESYEGVAIR